MQTWVGTLTASSMLSWYERRMERKASELILKAQYSKKVRQWGNILYVSGVST